MGAASDLTLLGRRERERVQRIALATRLTVARQWRTLDADALTESWDGGIGRRVTLTVAAAQNAAAQGAIPFVTAALVAQDLDPDAAEGSLVAEALAGIASDGRPLSSLLYHPIIDAKTRIGAGAGVDEAMRIGLGELERMIDTQVADAARVGIGVSSVANKEIQWYVRSLTPPSCARCAILAGKITSVEKAFLRHPRCDCINVPVGDKKLANSMVRDPKDYFNSLAEDAQNKTFTKAGAQAIRDGADIFQVVNARRGMSTAGSWVERLPGPELEGRTDLRVTHRGRTTSGQFTSEGMSRRGLAGQGLRSTPGARRLTPEGIYALASDRDEVIRLLRRFGYLT